MASTIVRNSLEKLFDLTSGIEMLNHDVLHGVVTNKQRHINNTIQRYREKADKVLQVYLAVLPLIIADTESTMTISSLSLSKASTADEIRNILASLAYHFNWAKCTDSLTDLSASERRTVYRLIRQVHLYNRAREEQNLLLIEMQHASLYYEGRMREITAKINILNDVEKILHDWVQWVSETFQTEPMIIQNTYKMFSSIPIDFPVDLLIDVGIYWFCNMSFPFSDCRATIICSLRC